MKKKTKLVDGLLLTAKATFLAGLIAIGVAGCGDNGGGNVTDPTRNGDQNNTCGGYDGRISSCINPVIGLQSAIIGESNDACNSKGHMGEKKSEDTNAALTGFYHGLFGSWSGRSDRKSHKRGNFSNPIIDRMESVLGVTFDEIPCFIEFDRNVGAENARDIIEELHR